ncbi:hypothetical protein ONZ45_g3457 [Pleurotus djamor]|nr:hypothetical protein ONZ45_g3457 [Pleurotus djamor]
METSTQDADNVKASNDKQRPDYYLSKSDMKLLGITATGNFLDSYDLFVINPLSTMLQFELFAGHALPPRLEGFLKSAALIGSVIGQVTFGYLGDAFGRKAIYGKELLTIIIGTILCLSTPTKQLSPSASLVYLAVFRIIVGIGVGGDYPMTSSIISDRTTPRRRGAMLAYTTAMQGWGNLAGNLVTIIVLAGYKHMIHEEGRVDQLDAVWRIVVAISLIPAFATVYQRLTLPESPLHLSFGRRYQDLDKINHVDADRSPNQEGADDHKNEEAAFEEDASPQPPSTAAHHKKAHIREFLQYFSEWRHAKLLIGTCLSWFFTNIAFFGVNLNQNFVLQQIGFDGSTGTPWQKLIRVSVGSLIITVLGFLPGYYVTILTSEKLGRKWIQIQGSLMTAIFMAILAAKFHTLNKASFIACFTFLQFFFNFGANMTIYIIPAELYPSRYRALGHGLSAASGRCGAIISSLLFNQLAHTVGTPIVLWVVTWFLLPEVKGRNADVVFEQELREREKDATR